MTAKSRSDVHEQTESRAVLSSSIKCEFLTEPAHINHQGIKFDANRQKGRFLFSFFENAEAKSTVGNRYPVSYIDPVGRHPALALLCPEALPKVPCAGGGTFQRSGAVRRADRPVLVEIISLLPLAAAHHAGQRLTQRTQPRSGPARTAFRFLVFVGNVSQQRRRLVRPHAAQVSLHARIREMQAQRILFVTDDDGPPPFVGRVSR